VATQRERLITVTPVEILPMMWIPGSLPTINSMLIGLFRFDGGGAAPHTDRRVALAGPATQMGALLTIGATSSRRQGALSYKFFISQGSAARRLLARSFARAIFPSNASPGLSRKSNPQAVSPEYHNAPQKRATAGLREGSAIDIRRSVRHG
jgi:hypothetical protein